MSYEINVSKNGRHYFATSPRSLNTAAETVKAYKDFKTRFPEKEGFSLSVNYDPQVSYGCWFNEQGEFVNGYYDKNK